MLDDSSHGVADELVPDTPRAALADFISTQDGRIGDVYRLLQDGLSARAIADRLNVGTVGFVYTNQAQIDAALDGKMPGGPTSLKQCPHALNGLERRGRATLPPDAYELLATNLAKFRQAVSDLDPVEEALAEAAAERDEETKVGSLQGVPGIYAFSYGWYLEKPVDPDGDNTLIKVGKVTDVAGRIEEHRSRARAHIPEPLVTVRVYAVDIGELDRVERVFHRLLSSAGHSNPRRERTSSRVKNEVGREWFLTNKNFLDEIASTLGLFEIYSDQ